MHVSRLNRLRLEEKINLEWSFRTSASQQRPIDSLDALSRRTRADLFNEFKSNYNVPSSLPLFTSPSFTLPNLSAQISEDELGFIHTVLKMKCLPNDIFQYLDQVQTGEWLVRGWLGCQ